MVSMEREIRAQTICLLAMLGFLVAGAFVWLQPVLLPFVLAVFIVSGVMPLLTWIEGRFKAPRLVSLGIATLLVFVLMFLLWTVIAVSIRQLNQNAGAYVSRVQELVAIVADRMPAIPDRELDDRPVVPEGPEDEDPPAEQDFPADEPAEPEAEPPDPAAPPPPNEGHVAVFPVIVDWQEVPQMLGTWVRSQVGQLTNSLIEITGSGTMVVIFVFFLLLGSTDTVPRSETWVEIDRKIRQYIVSKSLISLATGMVFGGILWLFGIPLAIVFGLLAFLFNFIPNIGPVFASLLPIPLIVLDPHLSIWGMILVITLTSGVQMISGNVVEPKIMGESFDLHPIAILLALMFWGMTWGIVGMFLATPITAAMKILFAKFEATRPLAELLAGRFDQIDLDFLNISEQSAPEEK